MTVVDASIVVRFLQNRPGDDRLRDRFTRERRVHAPALIDAEVASAIRGLLMASQHAIRISGDRAQQMIDDFAALPLQRYPMQPFHHQVLALRNNFTAYDAFYVTLAALLGMPLLTDDRKFAKTPSSGARVETWK